MTTTTYTLQDIRSYLIEAEEKNIKSPVMNFPNNNVYLYCLDTDTRVYITDLMIRKQNDWDYITVTGADGNSLSLWIDFDNQDQSGNKLTYQITIEHQEETETADDNNQETADDETADDTADNLKEVFNKVDRIVDQCQELSLNEILSIIGKLSVVANKKNKAENKPKKQKAEKPEKAEKRTDKKGRPSSKTFDYLDLLRNWHNSGLTPGEIENTELASGYGRHTIQEDLRVYNVLYNLDSKLVISEEWRDYIIGYWEQNPSTVWNRLHYAFAKDGRKCHDIDLLCNYVINNGVTKDDIINAIAAQN